MVGKTRGSTSHLKEDLIENGPAYDFFQALRLVGLLNKKNGKAKSFSLVPQKLRIRPELSLDYPGSDITEIQELEDKAGYAIQTTFMGLYGTSSPLPSYYTEDLIDAEWDEETAPREFLDIVHSHLYPLLFQAWLKHKFTHNAVERQDDSYWNILFSLFGLGTNEIKVAVKRPELFLRYIGLLSQQPKSAVGLKAILQDFLSPLKVDLLSCVERNVTIPSSQRMQLGIASTRLGKNAVVGEEITDRMGKVRICIGPLTADIFHAFVNDAGKIDFIKFLIRFYLTQALDFDFILLLDPGTLHSTTLGGNQWARLGQDTWMIDGSNEEQIRVVLATESDMKG